MATGVGNFSLFGANRNEVSSFTGELYVKLTSENAEAYKSIGYAKDKVITITPNTIVDAHGAKMAESYLVKISASMLQISPVQLREINTFSGSAIDLRFVIDFANENQIIFEVQDCDVLVTADYRFEHRGEGSSFQLEYEKEFSQSELESLWIYYGPPATPEIDAPENGATNVETSATASILAEADAELIVEFSQSAGFTSLLGSEIYQTNDFPEEVSGFRRVTFSLSEFSIKPASLIYMRAKITRNQQDSQSAVVSFTTTLGAPILSEIPDYYLGQDVVIAWSHQDAVQLVHFRVEVTKGGETQTKTYSTAFTEANLTNDFPDFVGGIDAYAVKVYAVSATEEKFAKDVFSIKSPEWDLIHPSVTPEGGYFEVQHNGSLSITFEQDRLPADDDTFYQFSLANSGGDSNITPSIEEVLPSGGGKEINPTINVKYLVDTGTVGSRWFDVKAENSGLGIAHYKTIQFLVKRETVASLLGNYLWADFDASIIDNASVDGDFTKSFTVYGYSETAEKLTTDGLKDANGTTRKYHNSTFTNSPWYLPPSENHKWGALVFERASDESASINDPLLGGVCFIALGYFENCFAHGLTARLCQHWDFYGIVTATYGTYLLYEHFQNGIATLKYFETPGTYIVRFPSSVQKDGYGGYCATAQGSAFIEEINDASGTYLFNPGYSYPMSTSFRRSSTNHPKGARMYLQRLVVINDIDGVMPTDEVLKNAATIMLREAGLIL